MRTLELLAPAHDCECGRAAIDHGADAVYIGAAAFGARAAAANSTADIAELCRHAHRYTAKVYVTVNTIIYDEEREATRALLDELEEAGADAILVQDMAVLGMLDGKAMAAHASTQTDNRTAEKVRWLRDIGFSRVVLARELSVSEIAAIRAKVPDVELEAFVHGSLCVSYSGLCYASQHCFGRSANRGECAQFCRLRFDIEDADGHRISPSRHFLSLKDMNRIDCLEELAEAGVTSFKIEGRLKDIAYVKNVTAAYSQRLNELVRKHPELYRRASLGECRHEFTPNLSTTFNRGYTTYFLDRHRHDIASMDTPKSKGEFVGTVKEMRGASFTVAGLSAFANGDGLCFMDTDGHLQGFRVNRAENNRLFPLHMPPGLHAGVKLYRNYNAAFERTIGKARCARKIGISMNLAPTDNGFALTAWIPGGPAATVETGFGHQQAKTPQADNITRQLTKLGTTIYECDHVQLPAGFDYFIPSGTLADMRRTAVDELEKQTAESLAQKRAGTHVTHAPAPKYSRFGYQYNVANTEARAFYAACGIENPSPAFELKPPTGGVLMQCRHCLRLSLGRCERHGGRKPEWKEPLSLVLPDGRRFPLEFDCRHCQMNVYADSGQKPKKK